MALLFLLGRRSAVASVSVSAVAVARRSSPAALASRRLVHASCETWPRLLPQQLLVAHHRRNAELRAKSAREEWTRRNAALVRRFPVCLALSPAKGEPCRSFFQRVQRLLRVALHLAKLLCLVAPLAVSAPLAFSAGAVLPQVQEQWWGLALWLAQFSSPAVMKFLQWASTRRDMFPASFCDRFERFHENAPLHSWQQTEDALRCALGSNWREIVAVDQEPIGSGCIAQVYRGRLRATGEEVAVKVIHPHVKKLVSLDLQIMRGLVSLLEIIPRLRWLGGKDSVDEFAGLMERQLNLRAEAENLVRFGEHFRGRKGLRFPKPLMEFTTESVLVESYEPGLHFSEIVDQLEPLRRKAVARVVLESYLRMVFLDNFAHGDMHPGNLLFEEQAGESGSTSGSFSKAKSNAGVVVVDAGIVTKLEPEDLRNFVELFHAVATGDGYKAGELIVSRSKPLSEQKLADGQPAPPKCKDLESFCMGMEKIVDEALSWRLNLRKVHVGALLREVMELCCTHEVKLEGKYASIVVSIAVLEAVGRKLDPDIDLLGVALPIIMQSLVKNVLN